MLPPVYLESWVVDWHWRGGKLPRVAHPTVAALTMPMATAASVSDILLSLCGAILLSHAAPSFHVQGWLRAAIAATIALRLGHADLLQIFRPDPVSTALPYPRPWIQSTTVPK